MIWSLIACIAPDLIESTEPTVNPGELEFVAAYAGPGALRYGRCDGYGLYLQVGPYQTWPVYLLEGQSADVWVIVGSGASGGLYTCEVEVPGRYDLFAVEVVEL